MVLLPQEDLVDYDVHIAQCLINFLKHVSLLTSVAQPM